MKPLPDLWFRTINIHGDWEGVRTFQEPRTQEPEWHNWREWRMDYDEWYSSDEWSAQKLLVQNQQTYGEGVRLVLWIGGTRGKNRKLRATRFTAKIEFFCAGRAQVVRYIGGYGHMFVCRSVQDAQRRAEANPEIPHLVDQVLREAMGAESAVAVWHIPQQGAAPQPFCTMLGGLTPWTESQEIPYGDYVYWTRVRGRPPERRTMRKSGWCSGPVEGLPKTHSWIPDPPAATTGT